MISYNWLQEYFEDTLPSAQEIADLFTFHVCEVEEVKEITLKDGSKDTLIDFKILPDRAHYALSHQGIAYELGALISKRNRNRIAYNLNISKDICPRIAVETPHTLRYMARQVNGITVTKSKQDVLNKLESISQRPINSIVDLMNYVMFDIGQPLHAFDADLIKGKITVRNAHESEKLTTLDGKEVELNSTIMIIADDAGPLAIAGIKGGKRAEVTDSTKNIIIEAANFDATSVRRTSTKIGIRTDASKRFENDISGETAAQAMDYVTHLVHQLNPDSVIGDTVDIYPHPEKPVTITVKPEEISEMLGVDIEPKEMWQLLERLQIGVETDEKIPCLTIPHFRKDLRIPEDIAEEVGRLYGYDKIRPQPLERAAIKEHVVSAYFYEQKIRHALKDLGFSEVYTPSLFEEGDIVIMNPLASDKRALRTNLTKGLTKALKQNLNYAFPLGLNEIKIFEIGTVFPVEGERISLAIGVHDLHLKRGGKKNEEHLNETLEFLSKKLDQDFSPFTLRGRDVYEIDLQKLVEILSKPKAYDSFEKPSEATYKQISQYPFTSRDIAVFVPESVTQDELQKIITEKAGTLLVRDTLFDVFKKEGKVSYAFRLVFQSHERTLTDDEINKIMESISATLAEKGWQVR
jgi:phenylalanyl-tRNA synthetase beta chain